jgi:hypothetical protein
MTVAAGGKQLNAIFNYTKKHQILIMTETFIPYSTFSHYVQSVYSHLYIKSPLEKSLF